jgi:hypothetical protein
MQLVIISFVLYLRFFTVLNEKPINPVLLKQNKNYSRVTERNIYFFQQANLTNTY